MKRKANKKATKQGSGKQIRQKDLGARRAATVKGGLPAIQNAMGDGSVRTAAGPQTRALQDYIFLNTVK